MPDASAMTSPPPRPDPDAEPAWFVQAAGQVWGPYSPTRVARFAAEGRVTSESLLGPHVEGPFHPAGRWRSLASLFRAATLEAPKAYQHQPAPILQTETARQPAPQPAPRSPPAARPDRPHAPPAGAALRPLMVWADLASLRADGFQALLARYGEVVAIRPTVWLVQARCDAAHLRNALSRRLTGADALMIVQAPLDKAAWFNLDTAAERRLRQVWGGGG